MIQVTFNGTNVYTAHKIMLEEFHIGYPDPKLIKVDIPGRDGDLDMSEALTGYVNYHNREINLKLGITGTEAECVTKQHYLIQLVSGLEVKVRFSHLKGYFIGRCQSIQSSRQHRHYSVELVFDCQPFRLEESEIVHTLTLSATEQTLTCVNDGVPITPTIYTSGSTTLKFKNKTYSVQSGTHRLGFIFGKGANIIKAKGTGTLTVRYRKGVL